MFKRAKLTNFRQHRNLEVFFTAGVNAIRGENEAGKTTLLEAMAYVLFGARIALREALADVVTWGEKEASLKAELDVEIDGVLYLGKRSKSGAEIWREGADRPLVTGVDECTKYWETLLGVPAKLSTNLMLANQASLRGALQQGAAAPVTLIQTLANFKIIDEIIALVMDEVPNGQTKAISERVQMLKDRLAEPVQAEGGDDLEGLVMAADADLQAYNDTLHQAEAATQAFAPTAQAAQTRLNNLEAARENNVRASRALATAEAALDAVEVPAAPDAEALPRLRAGLASAQNLAEVRRLRAKLEALGTPEAEWDEGEVELRQAVTDAQNGLQALQEELQNTELALVRANAAIIKETTCAFCDKDLTAVPEVLSKNKELNAKVAQSQARIAATSHSMHVSREELQALRAVLAEGARRDLVYAEAAKYIQLDRDYVPAHWTWTGPETSVGDQPDYAAQISAIEKAQSAYDRAAGRQQQAQAAVQACTEARIAATQALADATAAAEGAEALLTEAHRLAEVFAAAQADADRAQATVRDTRAALNQALAVQREREQATARLRADLERDENLLTDTFKGNELLDRLRSARPVIADRLWSVVLASVSTYFSAIRGQASTVTRTAEGFQVNGKGIDGLSGSTLDALGLAIRIALTKTFLPNARFMVLDEPAAACSETREVNMLALVATANFDQVILVTHSSLCDTFADQMIQL